MRKFNWQIWASLLLSLFALVSYPFLFSRFALTRDFAWANLLMFGIAIVLMLVGLRRAFASGRSHPVRSKIAGTILATLNVVILGLFVFSFFIMARWLPASHGAPQVGQKAPDFSLADTSGRQVSLTELLSSPLDANTETAGVPARSDSVASTAPKGVLLIFYRGYW